MTTNLTFGNGTTIEWESDHDGGGSVYYIDFLNTVSKERKYNNVLEWCAGLSAIAFSLVDANMVENCVLMDVYEPALIRAEENAKNNNLSNRVSIRVCDKINDLPVTDKFDLVVSNPPHFPSGAWIDQNNDKKDLIKRLTVDTDWELHKEFFKNITKYLSPNADLYISESDKHDFLIGLAKENGLSLIEVFPSPILANDTKTDAVILHFRYETKIY